MRAKHRCEQYASAFADEWLDIAARLPRGSRLRALCQDQAQIKGETWLAFTPDEWESVEWAAGEAGVIIAPYEEGDDRPAAGNTLRDKEIELMGLRSRVDAYEQIAARHGLDLAAMVCPRPAGMAEAVNGP